MSTDTADAGDQGHGPDASCEDLAEEAAEYLERALSPAQWLRMEDWLAPARGCQDYLRQIRRVIGEALSGPSHAE